MCNSVTLIAYVFAMITIKLDFKTNSEYISLLDVPVKVDDTNDDESEDDEYNEHQNTNNP